MKLLILSLTLAIAVNASAQTVSGWDAFLTSQYGGNNYQLIGTYQGWDPNGVYIAGYNYFNNNSLATKKVYIGSIVADLQYSYLGIGTNAPISPLHVSHNSNIPAMTIQNALSTGYNQIAFSGVGRQYNTGVGNNAEAAYGVANSWYVFDATTNAMRLVINANGNVLIGKTAQANANYLLDVNGNVRANSLVINTTGADFVFDSKYKLPPLSTVKQYIRSNHHLPGIASAKDMQLNGLDLGEGETKLLQKVEELTLYLIEKDKQILNQQKELDEQKALIKDVQKELKELKKSKQIKR